jgi:hypothetical protein
MTEQQLAILFKYIDVTITAAIQHEIGGETKDLLELQNKFKKQLSESLVIAKSKSQIKKPDIVLCKPEAPTGKTDGLKLLDSVIGKSQ